MESYIKDMLEQMGRIAHPHWVKLLESCAEIAPENVISLNPAYFSDQQQVVLGGDEDLHFLAILLSLLPIFAPGNTTGAEEAFAWLRPYSVEKRDRGMEMLNGMHQWQMRIN